MCRGAVLRSARVIWWPYAGVALIAIALRFYHLDAIPLWTDELFTRFYSTAGLSTLWGEGFRAEPTSPLYYTIIAGVEHVLGSQAWALRLPSVAGSLASVVLAWALGRELSGRPGAALLAALLLSLAPINVFYAQEARSYALQGAAIALALLGFARVLRGGSGLALYGVGAVLAIWLHPTSVVVVAAINAGAVASAIGRDRLLTPVRLWRWIGVNGLVLVACLPLVGGIVAPPDGGAATSWIAPLSRWTLENVLGETLGGPALSASAQRIAEFGGLAVAVLALVPPWRPGRRAAIVLVLVPGLALVAMIGISAIKPILLSRTLAWLLVPLAVSLGAILSSRPVSVGAVVVAVFVGALGVQINRGATLKEDWPGLFAQMPKLDAPALLVLGPHSPPGAVAVYAPTVSPVRLDDGGPPSPETTIMPRLFGTPTLTRAQLTGDIAAGQTVWLAYRRPEYAWVQRELAGLPTPARAIQSEPGSNPALRAICWTGTMGCGDE